MEINVSHEQGHVPITVLHLKGELNSEEPLRSYVQEAFDTGTRNLLLDLSEVSYISSSGLRALHHAYNLLHEGADGNRDIHRGIIEGTYKSPYLKLLDPSKNVLKVLNIAGYDMFLDIHKNRRDALASF